MTLPTPQALSPLSYMLTETVIYGLSYTGNMLLHQAMTNLIVKNTNVSLPASLTPYINTAQIPAWNHKDISDYYMNQQLPFLETRRDIERPEIILPLVKHYEKQTLEQEYRRIDRAFPENSTTKEHWKKELSSLYQEDLTIEEYASALNRLQLILAQENPQNFWLGSFIQRATPESLYFYVHHSVSQTIGRAALIETGVLTNSLSITKKPLTLYRGLKVENLDSFIDNLFTYGHESINPGAQATFPYFSHVDRHKNNHLSYVVFDTNVGSEGITSWTTKKESAYRFAGNKGYGVGKFSLVIEAKLPKKSLVFPHQYYSTEKEIMVDHIPARYIRSVHCIEDNAITKTIINPAYEGPSSGHIDELLHKFADISADYFGFLNFLKSSDEDELLHHFENFACPHAPLDRDAITQDYIAECREFAKIFLDPSDL
jgi:hypothetical protein